ncbi:MAG: ATP-binding protein [Alphaproteobacteria bacterium]|nr:ATP-binding protein [Alphaproteobacteria bacterium]MCD8525842.1 ATP-binding protein [Alphaproteobacteria bacterium]
MAQTEKPADSLNSVPKHWAPPVNFETFQKVFHKASLFQRTALRPYRDNDFAGLEKLSDITGDTVQDLAIFSPQRLLLQETIIACDSRLYIEDDNHDVEAYGENFREIFEIIYERYVKPEAARLFADLDEKFAAVERDVTRDVADLLDSENPDLWLYSALMAGGDNGGYEETAFQREQRRKVGSLDTYYRRLVRKGVDKTRSPQEFKDLLIRLVTARTYDLTARDYLLHEIKGCIKEAIADNEVTALERINAKDALLHIIHGPPSAGKTTLRPRIMQAARNQGISWASVMVLNADVWREFLLEGKDLGEDADYWGPLTDNELSIMWDRMDILLRRKWHIQPHIAVDHFYPDRSELATYPNRTDHFHTSLLLAHPDQIIQRSYNRGQIEGRYITVPELLYHMRETYKAYGPYFRSAAGENVRIEIVDNAVPLGMEPKTVAFGDMSKDELNVFDVAGILLIDRYRQVNPAATKPSELFDMNTRDLANNLGFLDELADNLTLKFADGHMVIYAVYSKQKGLTIYDGDFFESRKQDPYYRAAFDRLTELAQKGRGVHCAENNQKLAVATAGMIGVQVQDCFARTLVHS